MSQQCPTPLHAFFDMYQHPATSPAGLNDVVHQAKDEFHRKNIQDVLLEWCSDLCLQLVRKTNGYRYS